MRDPDAGDPPSISVQWKGTDLCAGFRCQCGAEGHIDDYFCYSISCEACGQVYVLPRTIQLLKAEEVADFHAPEDARPVVMDGRWRD